MFKKIKTGFKILKEKGLKAFLIVLYNKIMIHGVLLYPFRKILWPRLQKNITELIKKLNNFNSSEPEKIFDFSWNFYLGFIRPMQIKEEFLELLKIFKELNPKYILEIGTADGGTLFCFCKLADSNATIVSIDFGGYPEWKIPIYQAFKKENQRLYLLRKDSHKKETLDEVLKILNGNQVDFLFIDGDHTYEGVKKDFEMYGPLVRKGGIVAFHDIVPRGELEKIGEVPLFWREIKNNLDYKEIIKDLDQLGWGIGIIYK